MYDDAMLFLDDSAVASDDAHETVDADHRRIETRRLRVVHDVEWLAKRYRFPGLTAPADLVATRETADGRIATSRRVYAFSRRLTAAHALAAIRVHGGVENKLHWILDAILDEDRSRARTDNASLNLAVLRRIALNMARASATKGSIRGKIKRAGWDNAFLVELLVQMR